MLDGMSDSIQGSRIENLQSREVDRQSPTGLIFFTFYVYVYFYFWSRVSGVTILRRPCGIEYCGCICVCFMLILMFCSLICLKSIWIWIYADCALLNAVPKPNVCSRRSRSSSTSRFAITDRFPAGLHLQPISCSQLGYVQDCWATTDPARWSQDGVSWRNSSSVSFSHVLEHCPAES